MVLILSHAANDPIEIQDTLESLLDDIHLISPQSFYSPVNINFNFSYILMI